MLSLYKVLCFSVLGICLLCDAKASPRIEVASKNFTESYILGESISQLIETHFPELQVVRRLGMGGTGLVFTALESGSIDLYVEYTGTLKEAILKDPDLRSLADIQRALAARGLRTSDRIGFNNTYAFVLRRELAETLGLSKTSELARLPEEVRQNIRAAFSYEFLNRADGYPAAAQAYGFEFDQVRAVEHAVTYEALRSGSIDLSVAYTTDAKLIEYGLQVLEDDKNFFPEYDAIVLTRAQFVEDHPEVWALLKSRLEHQISETEMVALNSLVDIDNRSYSYAASVFLTGEEYQLSLSSFALWKQIRWKELWQKTLEHLFLVLVSLGAAILVGLPLGMLAIRNKLFEQIILSVSGLIQTIPSLALLVLFIPLLGVGLMSSLVAIFLYSLLPIVRGVHSGFSSIDANYINASKVLGLNAWQRNFWIEIPLCSIAIFSGVKTSAVISVGTATLAAFIGGGGYGEFIIQGLAMTNTVTILHGAIPAILMALGVQYTLDLLERLLIPKGLKLSLRS